MSIEASEGAERYKSSVADRMASDKIGSFIRKRGRRRTEVEIPVNDDPEGPSVLLSLENEHGRSVHFHHQGTIYPRKNK